MQPSEAVLRVASPYPVQIGIAAVAAAGEGDDFNIVSMPLVYCCDAVDDLQQQRQEPPQLFSDPQQAVKDIVSAYTAEQGFKEISVEVG